jgi:aminopeptidase N
MRHLTASSGRDLSRWTSDWLQTTGINALEPDFEVGPDGTYTRFEIIQAGAQPGAGELRAHRLAVGIYADDSSGALVRTHRTELDVSADRTPVPDLVGVAAGALVLVNDDDLTYCKLALDGRSLTTAISRIGDIAESLPRTLVWSAVWEMTRDAKMRARDFVALALSGISGEDQIGVVQRVLQQVSSAIGAYADPQWADQGWAAYTGKLLELATTSEPGSDLQLSAVNALCASKLSAEQLRIIDGWRDGSAPLAGLTVDADLFWSLLSALVAHGAATAADIEAAAAADPTASGQRRAMTATALRPDAASKAAIWQRLISDDGMANALQDAAISGFSHPAQGDLLAEYAAKYFAVVDDVWARRSNEVAQKVAIGLYPRWAVSAGTADAAKTWQAGEHPPALARLVSEGRSGTERALRARAYDKS